MDASGAVYYQNDHHRVPDDDQANDSKRCSVRGCGQPLSEGSQNKMCEVCRSRHRIYASTKRARRKMEKAAVASVVEAREPVFLIHDSDGTVDPGLSAVSQQSWLSPDGQYLHQGNVSQDSHQSTSTATSPISSSSLPNSSWNHAIDPRLFSGEVLPSHSTSHSSTSRFLPPPKPHQTTSSSELANALTLPASLQPVQKEHQATGREEDNEGCRSTFEYSQHQSDQQTNTDNGQLPPHCSDEKETSRDGENDVSGAPTRFCSVKGCKLVIPASYEYKMCPSCRTRYRTYGNTKRAKWKAEREAFDREMAGLRALEDEKRKAEGLGPLADDPDELRAWELSVIDEQVPLPAHHSLGVSAPGAIMDVGMSASTATLPGDIHSSMVMAGVYPATVGSIDTPHSISPYPHLNDPLLAATMPPLPARMCTVSHCHKILPGFYRYKRCEQHRLQNRYHSKLKRVREKEVKAVGPDDDAKPLEIVEEMGKVRNPEEPGGAEKEAGSEARKGKKVKVPKVPKEKRPPKEKKDKGKGKETEKEKGEDGVDGAKEDEGVDSSPERGENKKERKSHDKAQKRSKHSCNAEECHNLLTPGTRWRMCEECRAAERRRKMEVKRELQAAQAEVAKNAQQMAANVAEEGAAASLGQGAAPVRPVQMDEHASAGDMDADGDEEEEAEKDEKDDGQPAPQQLIAEFIHEEIPLPATTQPYTGFSKFRVDLPPPPAPLPTAAELMKLDDPLAFRAFKPKTTPSAIGRLLARNPQISVDAFTDILEAQGTTTTEQASSSKKESQAVGSSTSVIKSVPTPTIPTSAPFVYRAPSKKGSVVEEEEKLAMSATSAVATKGKRKASSQNSMDSTSAMPAPAPSTSTPPPTTYNPYGYPPSYPYYPYYAPPYSMAPPYSYQPTTSPADVKKNGSKTKTSSATASTSSSMAPMPPMPGYPPMPYPYPPPPMYGYPPPPSGYPPSGYPPPASGYPPPQSGYPYMPPRYMAPSYGQTSGQQPYPGLGTPAGPGSTGTYPYYMSTPSASVSAPPRSPIPKKTAALPPKSKPQPQSLAEPKDAKFSYYHYGAGDSESPTTPRKRRKIDPNYLEKHMAQVQVIAVPLVGNRAGVVGTSSSMTSTAMAETSTVSSSAITTQSEMEDAGPAGPEQSSSTQSTVQRQCSNKTCNRTLPADAHGTICEKCKLRFKKHQAKTKQKFKLEPRTSLLDKLIRDNDTGKEGR